MRGSAPVYPNNSNGKIEMSYILVLLLLIGNIMLLLGLAYLIWPDTRLQRIKEYNAAVLQWNEKSVLEMENAAFTITVNSSVFHLDTVNSTFGEYYAQRDTCSEEGDIECEEATALYYSAHFNSSNDQINISLFDSDNKESILYQDVIQSLRKDALSKRVIGCDGGGTEACSTACKAKGGKWVSTQSYCYLVSYLSHICLRVFSVNTTQGIHYQLDTANRGSLFGENVLYGCEYIQSNNTLSYLDSHSWQPYHFLPARPASIRFELRHVDDPYIRASSLTQGCSSQTLSAHRCFGTSKHAYSLLFVILTIVGGTALIATVLLTIMARTIYYKDATAPTLLRFCNGATSPQPEESVVSLPLEEKRPLMLSEQRREETVSMKSASNVDDGSDPEAPEVPEGEIRISPRYGPASYRSSYDSDDANHLSPHDLQNPAFVYNRYEGCEDGI